MTDTYTPDWVDSPDLSDVTASTTSGVGDMGVAPITDTNGNTNLDRERREQVQKRLTYARRA